MQPNPAKLQHCSRSKVGPWCIRFQHCLTQRWLCNIQLIKMLKSQRDLWLGHRLLPWLQHHSSLTGLTIRLSYLSAAHYTPTTLACSPGGRRMRLLTPGRRRWSPPCPLVWGGWSINSMPSTPDSPMFWSRRPSNDGGMSRDSSWISLVAVAARRQWSWLFFTVTLNLLSHTNDKYQMRVPARDGGTTWCGESAGYNLFSLWFWPFGGDKSHSHG